MEENDKVFLPDMSDGRKLPRAPLVFFPAFLYFLLLIMASQRPSGKACSVPVRLSLNQEREKKNRHHIASAKRFSGNRVPEYRPGEG